MAGRYERVREFFCSRACRILLTVTSQVNAHDDNEPGTPAARTPSPTDAVPNSPPPSFHSRASSVTSQERNGRVDAALADAFDTEGDDSDDEPDDRQRLVRGNSFPASPDPARAGDAASNIPRATVPERQTTQSSQPSGQAAPYRVYGGGIQSDGVFSNLAAKPDAGGAEKEEQPPVCHSRLFLVVRQRRASGITQLTLSQTYEQAAADQAPPYWETTILAPGLAGPDEVYIDGLPVGSFFSFIWNGMISMSFQLVGFLLTYLLHSSHAAKNGSRAGLGVTLIQYGFYMKSTTAGSGGMGGSSGSDGHANPPDPNAHDFDPNTVTDGGSGGGDIASSEWVSYILMIVGWFILIRAVSDYLKARRHEQLVLQSPDRGLGVPIIAQGEGAETVV